MNFESFHYDFCVMVWGFDRVVQLNNVFIVKRNDVKIACLQILQFPPSSYIIYSPHALFPICPYPLFFPLVLHFLFPYPLILSIYSLFQIIHVNPYSYLHLNSIYPNLMSLLILGLNSPTKTSFHMMIEIHPNTPYIRLIIIPTSFSQILSYSQNLNMIFFRWSAN